MLFGGFRLLGNEIKIILIIKKLKCDHILGHTPLGLGEEHLFYKNTLTCLPCAWYCQALEGSVDGSPWVP